MAEKKQPVKFAVRGDLMLEVLESHIDDFVEVLFRADRANNNDGSMIKISGIIQDHPSIRGAFIIVTSRPAAVKGKTEPCIFEIRPDDVLAVTTLVPQAFYDAIVKKAQAKHVKEIGAMAEAVEAVNEHSNLIIS